MLRVDGTPGVVYLRWSGGKLQFVNSADGTVILAVDPALNQTEQPEAAIAEAAIAELTAGRLHLASGEILATAAELNDAGRFSRNSRVGVATLSAAAAADDIVFAWKNPEAVPIVVYRVIASITKAGGTAGALIDVGSAADAVTGSDDLIDGADANAVAAYDNLQAVTGAGSIAKIAVDAYVNGQIKVEKAEDLEGTVYILYTTA